MNTLMVILLGILLVVCVLYVWVSWKMASNLKYATKFTAALVIYCACNKYPILKLCVPLVLHFCYHHTNDREDVRSRLRNYHSINSVISK